MVFNLPKTLDSITESDLHAAASKYLVNDNLTVLNVVKENKPNK